jgi:hypothetical protein
MIVSSGSAQLAPSVKFAVVTPPFELAQAFDRLKRMPAKLNETGMFASERVHVREIVMVQAPGTRPSARRDFRLVACRPAAASI